MMKEFFCGFLIGLFLCAGPVFAETCPDPEALRGDDVPPNWDEMDRNLNEANYFGEIINNLAYVQGFTRAEIHANSVICRYEPMVSMQKFGSAEPKQTENWQKKEFGWLCKKGWEECEFW